jgi:hypothetical protein
MPKLYFPNGVPLLFKLVFGMTLVNIVVLVSAGWWVRGVWAPATLEVRGYIRSVSGAE